jgi:hypothetical protein
LFLADDDGFAWGECDGRALGGVIADAEPARVLAVVEDRIGWLIEACGDRAPEEDLIRAEDGAEGRADRGFGEIRFVQRDWFREEERDHLVIAGGAAAFDGESAALAVVDPEIDEFEVR